MSGVKVAVSAGIASQLLNISFQVFLFKVFKFVQECIVRGVQKSAHFMYRLISPQQKK